MTGRPAGRRPGDPDDTRRDILAAARRRFATHGFDRATVRSIAADAGVDPALINHHFGSKQGLFVAAHELPVDPMVALEQIAGLPVPERGRAVARTYLRAFARSDSAVLSLLRAAATEPSAARLLREFVESTVLAAGRHLLVDPDRDGDLRTVLLASHLLGVIVVRQLLEIGPAANATVADLTDQLGPVLQRYIEGDATRTG